ncbi:MAG: PilZ domain-containing protein [Nitrospirota bacterium]
MERRYSERIKAGYRTEIFYRDGTYFGVVENISASGVNVLTDELAPGFAFTPDDPIELNFRSLAGSVILLKCTIMWTSKIPPQNLRHRIGMEIDKSCRDKVDFL